ncbi:MAG: DUF4292 domain-containing protein [Deltaproteobacteria bacterium]|nr:MAG: DUF4292 domain-containing protein [Deltaproteobacteria bacterium]
MLLFGELQEVFEAEVHLHGTLRVGGALPNPPLGLAMRGESSSIRGAGLYSLAGERVSSRFKIALVVLALGAGCNPKKKPVAEITQPAITILERVQARPSPSPLQARFQIKVRSKPLGLGGTTGGGIQVVRPGRARLEVFGPFGGSLASLTADGERFAAYMSREQRHLLAPDAEALIREATRGAIGLDGAIGLLVGDVPFEAGELQETAVLQDEGRVRASYLGPDQVRVDLALDPEQLTPVGFEARDRDGEPLILVTYEGWHAFGETLLPQRVEVTVPAVSLFVSLRYHTWQQPDQLMTYDTRAPAGLQSEPLVEILRLSLAALRAEEDEAAP